MKKELLYTVFMSTDAGFVLKTVVSFLIGILISMNIIPAESKDVFTNDATTIGGLIISIISVGYLLEHALIKGKDDVEHTDWSATTTPQVTTETTPEVTPQPSV